MRTCRMVGLPSLVIGAFVLFGAQACVSDKQEANHSVHAPGVSAPSPAAVEAPPAELKGEQRFFPPVEPGRTRASYVATGQKAMIATAHPLATEAGYQVLRDGGNAFDAAVAASFVISVVRPQSTGIGGGGFLVGHESKSRHTMVYDFRERAPAGATRDMFLDAKGEPASFTYEGRKVPNASVNGHLAVGVPGLVKGLLKIHKKYGKLPLSRVMQPAIEVAEKGFTVYGGLAHALTERSEIMRQFPGTVKVFFPGGQALKVGDTLVQKDLAWTLRQIAKRGEAAYYKGEIAQRLLKEMRRGHGLMTQKDLANYQVLEREPVVGTYRGYKIVSMPPPSSGGVHIIEILNMLAGDDFGKMGFGSVASVHLLTEAMRRAFADRAVYLGDPDFVKIPLKGLLSPTYAQALRRTIDMTKSTPSSAVNPGKPADYESPSTSHLSVVDAWGNAVSTTQTVNFSFGSCVVAEGTGIVLNDEMDDFSKKPGSPNAFGLLGYEANAVAARKTMLSSMSPTLVYDPKGDLRLVVGSPGGPRIISATLQTIINVIDFHMPLADAVHATRIHHQWQPDVLRYEENGLRPEVVAALTKMGHKLEIKGNIGDVQAIGMDGGTLTGVSDTRAEGKPMGF